MIGFARNRCLKKTREQRNTTDRRTGSRLHRVFPSPREFSPGGENHARLYRLALGNSLAELGLRSRPRTLRRPAATMGRLARHFIRAIVARELCPHRRQFGAVTG